ncbi:MAG: hypothetical protein SXA11_03910 [Cyanobacteriota bacterium]|nr:hypothetical protein [Cyanobacteriota bacterium]
MKNKTISYETAKALNLYQCNKKRLFEKKLKIFRPFNPKRKSYSMAEFGDRSPTIDLMPMAEGQICQPEC